MRLKDHTECITLAVTDLGKTDLFIGHDWLKLHNPSIDWQTSTVVFDRCPEACGYNLDFLDIDADPDPDMEPEPALEEGDRLFMLDWQSYVSSGTQGWSLRGASTGNAPDYMAEFPDVFSEEEFNKLLPCRPWNHCIKLNADFKPVNCKIYALTLDEQKALDVFLEENLRTRWIQSSNSPMASLFFFIKKADGTL